jgi:hypothetical protein
MTENKYATLWELFLDAQKHAKHNHCDIVADDDRTTMMIGWGCAATGTSFRVRLVDIKNRSALRVPGRMPGCDASANEHIAHDLITRLITTSDGRKQLTMLLNIGFTTPGEMLIAYERICKLKVFW